jgi:hypothetical protein
MKRLFLVSTVVFFLYQSNLLADCTAWKISDAIVGSYDKKCSGCKLDTDNKTVRCDFCKSSSSDRVQNVTLDLTSCCNNATVENKEGLLVCSLFTAAGKAAFDKARTTCTAPFTAWQYGSSARGTDLANRCNNCMIKSDGVLSCNCRVEMPPKDLYGNPIGAPYISWKSSSLNLATCCNNTIEVSQEGILTCQKNCALYKNGDYLMGSLYDNCWCYTLPPDGTLTCSCLNTTGKRIISRLSGIANCCNGTFANENGMLTCQNNKWVKVTSTALPNYCPTFNGQEATGTYKDKDGCINCSTSQDLKLTCTCGNVTSTTAVCPHRTTIDLTKCCNGTLVNKNGALTCLDAQQTVFTGSREVSDNPYCAAANL